jgi:ubiquinone biosynthesis protein COQ9
MNQSPDRTPSEVLRGRWLDCLVPRAGREGWTEAAATTAAAEAGLSAGEQALAAPGGVADLVDAFFDAAGRKAADALTPESLSGLNTPGKVAAGIKAWLAVLEPDRAAVRRAAARGFLPQGAGPALARTWKVADWIWTAAGDTATDYNRYSKRGLLASVLPGIVWLWLDGPDEDRLDAEIARRLAFASGAGRSLGRFAKPVLDALTRRGDKPTSPFGP